MCRHTKVNVIELITLFLRRNGYFGLRGLILPVIATRTIKPSFPIGQYPKILIGGQEFQIGFDYLLQVTIAVTAVTAVTAVMAGLMIGENRSKNCITG
jgi:hypothetical protein